MPGYGQTDRHLKIGDFHERRRCLTGRHVGWAEVADSVFGELVASAANILA